MERDASNGPALVPRPGISRRAWAATIAVAWLAACGGGGGGAAALPAPAALAAPGVWVVMGSSTAEGVGASVGQGWAAHVARQAAPLRVTLVNLARAGALTPQALPTATPPTAGRPGSDSAINIDRALAHAPRLVLLAFPSNDAVAGYPAAETVAHLSRLREIARAASAATILLSSQPRDGLTAAQQATLNDTDRLGAVAFGECFVDVRAALAGPDGGIAAAYAAGDGVHLNDAGHRLIADRLWALLESGRCVRLRTP